MEVTRRGGTENVETQTFPRDRSYHYFYFDRDLTGRSLRQTTQVHPLCLFPILVFHGHYRRPTLRKFRPTRVVSDGPVKNCALFLTCRPREGEVHSSRLLCSSDTRSSGDSDQSDLLKLSQITVCEV